MFLLALSFAVIATDARMPLSVMLFYLGAAILCGLVWWLDDEQGPTGGIVLRVNGVAKYLTGGG